MMNPSVTRNLTADILERPSSFDVAHESRAQALQQFRQLGLPTGKHEEYRFTPITKYLEKNFDWHVATAASTQSSIGEFLIPNLDANLIVLVNGRFQPLLSKIVSLDSEVTIITLHEAFLAGHPAVQEHYNQYLANETDAFAALNSAHWQDGVFIHVASDTAVSKPIFILHLNDATQGQVIAQTRILAVLEKGSSLQVITKSDSAGDQAAFHNLAEEWVLKDQAHLTYYKIQNDAGTSCQVANTVIHQSLASKLNTFTVTLNGHVVRNNLHIVIDGENCESHFYGLYLLTGSTHGDNHTVVDHRKPHSFSNELYKGILDGNSKGVFNGKIYVRPHAQKTNAFQSNRNILVSDAATVNTKPQLEIWADDVKCSHGCTSGQLDEEALFYLRSRGISETNAKAMLLYAFAAEVLEPIQHETLKTYLDQLIAARLHKDF